MSKLKQLIEKAKGLEAKDPKKAVELWIGALNSQDSEGESNPDLSIYNRIGDLYIKLRDPGQAADYYDQAVDKYAELGFHNNAIAMCNKVLRNAPARQATYLKLAKLYAAKGFMSEAKQNFVEYAERMQKAGKIEHAFAALKEFTDISPESANLREMLAEQLKMYGSDPGKRGSSARVSTPAAPKAPPGEQEDVHKSGKRKTSSLVFLDLDEPRVAKGTAPGAKAAPAAPLPPPPPSVVAPPVAERLIKEVVPEPDESLEIETTSLVDEAPGSSGGMLEGLETTHADFGQVAASSPNTPSIREELNPSDLELESLAELEPTAPEPTAPEPTIPERTTPEVRAEEVTGLEDADLVFAHTQRAEVKRAGARFETLEAVMKRQVPQATTRVPNPALSTQAGGVVAMDPRESQTPTALQGWFEIELELPATRTYTVGERVYVRFEHGWEPVGFRLYRSVRQLFMKRFVV